jgi:hypothetical protein
MGGTDLADGPRVDTAHCKSCGSQNLRGFKGELAMLLPGAEKLVEPTVLVWSEFVVCLACGAGQFVVPERELHLLAEGSGAAR